MNISILCSDSRHPIYPLLLQWVEKNNRLHDIRLAAKKSELSGGDILFLISCHEIIDIEVRKKFKATLVLHASDLPEGRGWSPHVWQILEGRNLITVTLLEAEDIVDSGAIWHQVRIQFEGHEIHEEINKRLFMAELELMDFAVNYFGKVTPRQQDQREPSHYRRRNPEDSRIDPARPIAEQFDLLRVADPLRFPAFFDFRGHRYTITISKVGQQETS